MVLRLVGMRVGSRFMAIFGLAAALAIILGMIALYNQYRFANAIRAIYDTAFEICEDSAQIAQDITNIGAAMKDILVSGGQVGVSLSQDKIAALDGSIDHHLMMMEPRYTGNPIDIATLRQDLIAWRGARASVVDLVRAGNLELARTECVSIAIPLFIKVKTDSDVLRDFAHANSMSRLAEVERAFRSLMLGSGGTLIVGLVACFVLARSMSRRLVAPLNAFQAEILEDCGGLIKDGQDEDELSQLLVAYRNLSTSHKVALRALEREVADHRSAREQLDVAQTIYMSSSEAMMVCDSRNHILAVNPAFTAITGYGIEEIVGRNPKFLGSGRQDTVFYQRMWRTLIDVGSWQGEIWNRRKNGDVYPEWLTINTIRDQEGNVRKFVALFSDITQRKRAEEQLWQRSNYDDLTGLPNRRLMVDRLDHALKKAKRADSGLALMLIDIDQFKEVNDVLGHEIGDLQLVEIANRLKSCVREADTVARLGGDEFTVILSEVVETGIIERIAQDINRALSQPFQIGTETVHSSASIGVALYPSDGDDASTLLKHADQAMYTSKAEGRNRYRYFTPAIQEAAFIRSRLINDLHAAVEAHEFQVHFQPIVNIATGNIDKAEVLLRWDHPRTGLMGPDLFISAAEETGLIVPIGDWVFREATFQLKQWIDKTGRNMSISINASPIQFTSGIDIQSWIDHLGRLGLPGNLVIIEITEGLFLHPTPMVIEQLNTLRAAGLQVAIDDFGTGYSALSYLRNFEIDLIKIDQSFIRNLDSTGNDLALSEAIIAMAHKLGYEVVAEGVETERQRDLLSGVACDQAQGYLYSRPLPAEEFETLLLRAEAKRFMAATV